MERDLTDIEKDKITLVRKRADFQLSDVKLPHDPGYDANTESVAERESVKNKNS